MKQKTKTKGMSTIGLILILLAFLLALGLVFYLLFMRGFWRDFYSGIQPGQMMTATPPGANTGSPIKNTADARIVGTWESDCLVPDPGSKWAEQHQFIINADGTAQHTRWSNDGVRGNCKANATTLVDNFTYAVPSSGKINFHWVETGGVIFDIYQLDASSLYFGHGFRGDHADWGTKTGGSESDRFDTLNKFINYKKIK